MILEVEEIELDVCLAGHGSWFDAQELRLLFLAAELNLDLESELQSIASQRSKRRCPRCRRRLQQVSLRDGATVLDRCPRGHGLWFDPGELATLASESLAQDQASLRQVQEYLRKFFPAEMHQPGASS